MSKAGQRLIAAAQEASALAQLDEAREIISDLIIGARRDRSLIIKRLGNEHVIETRVTKGQTLRAIRFLGKQ